MFELWFMYIEFKKAALKLMSFVDFYHTFLTVKKRTNRVIFIFCKRIYILDTS